MSRFGKGKLMQYIIAITANISSFSMGVAFSWTSPVLARMNQFNYSPFGRYVSLDESMWMGALVCLGMAIGPFPVAYITDKIGRKWTAIWSALPTLAAWILIASANSVIQVLIARFLIGLCGSVVFAVIPRYVAEIADDDIRGGLGSFLQVFVCAGMLFAYCVGPFVSYVLFGSICAFVPLVFVISFFWMPRSPYFLIAKGRHEDAIQCLMRIRGKSSEEVEEEAAAIQTSINESLESKSSYRELFTTPSQRWPLIIMFGVASALPLSGATAVQIYAEPIFVSTNTDISSALLAIIIGTIQMVTVSVTPYLFNHFGRKTLLLVGATGATISLMVFGAYFYFMDDNGLNKNYIKFVPISCIICFIICNCIGFGGVSWVIMSEIFPIHLISRALASGVCLQSTIAFFISLYFVKLGEALSEAGIFWLFGIFTAIAGLFVLLVVPETKGLSFQEIDQTLKKGIKVCCGRI